MRNPGRSPESGGVRHLHGGEVAPGLQRPGTLAAATRFRSILRLYFRSDPLLPAGSAPRHHILPIDRVSLVPAFDGLPMKRDEPIFIEHENHAFVIDGDWKLVGQRVSPP